MESESPIEPCATSSEKNNLVMNTKQILVHVPSDKLPFKGIAKIDVYKDGFSVEWVAPSPTGDRDCEELKKELERLKGEFDTLQNNYRMLYHKTENKL